MGEMLAKAYVEKRTRIMILISLLLWVRYLMDIRLEYDMQVYNGLVYLLILLSANYTRNLQYIPFLFFAACNAMLHPDAARVGLILLLCFASRDTNITHLSRLYMLMSSFLIGITLLRLALGITTDETYQALSMSGGIRIRHSLGVGFGVFHTFVFPLVLNLYISYYNRIRRTLLLTISMLLGYWGYAMEGSNAILISCASLVALDFLFNTRNLNRLLSRKILLYPIPVVMVIIVILSGILSLYFPGFNKILTNRGEFVLKFLQNVSYEDMLLGNKSIVATKDYYVDTSHLRLIFEGGVAFFLFYYMIYIKAIKWHLIVMKRAGWREKSPFLPVIFSILIMALSENVLFEISNIATFIFWAYLFNMAGRYDDATSRLGNQVLAHPKAQPSCC